jgi:hypothetical protein
MWRPDTHYTTCECYSHEHIIRWIYDDDEDMVYTEIYLSQYQSFFKRVFIAIKYIFGYRSKYGHWDSVIIRKEETVRLRDFLSDAIDDME